MSDKLDLDYQFDFYLEKVKLKKEHMSAVQLKETKQAFIAGFTQMMVIMTEIGTMPFIDSAPIIHKLWTQCSDYWAKTLVKIQQKEN